MVFDADADADSDADAAWDAVVVAREQPTGGSAVPALDALLLDALPLDAPLLGAWVEAMARHDPFTIPGHQRRAGRLSAALGRLLESDVPLYGGLDTVKLGAGHLAAAEERAARLWGADRARFSTGGSTHGNQAALLAVARLPGDGVLVARNAHRSVLSGLVLTGLRPTWLPVTVGGTTAGAQRPIGAGGSTAPRRSGAQRPIGAGGSRAVDGVPVGVDPDRLRLALENGPRPKAVLLTEPSYLGGLSDLPGLVAAAHDHDVPVVVDQAWGAHLGFHPAYPQHAIEAGADVLVCSVHKTLLGYSQACLVLARTQRIPDAVLDDAVELTATTSPAGSVLASIDASRALLEADGPRLLGALAERVAGAGDRLRALPGVLVPGPEDLPAGRFDPAKLVIRLTGGARGGPSDGSSGGSPSDGSSGGAPDGIAVENALLRNGIRLEMADRDTLVPIVTLVDTDADLDRLCAALEQALTTLPSLPRPSPDGTGVDAASPEQVMTPRDAHFAPTETLPWREAVGRVSAELIAPYPPGVPEIVPGERISRQVIERLRDLAAAGTRVAYAADRTLDTLRVVRSAP